jgi:hypothetical protein
LIERQTEDLRSAPVHSSRTDDVLPVWLPSQGGHLKCVFQQLDFPGTILVARGSSDSQQSVGCEFRRRGLRQVSDLDEIGILQPTFPKYLDPSVFLATNRDLGPRRSAQQGG